MDEKQKWNPRGFVESVIRRGANDTAFRAVMRRADNSRTAPSAWEYLTPWCDIGNDRERLAFGLIGAAVARESGASDGAAGLGAAFRACGTDAESREREQRRFRRVLGCDTAGELCEVLRPVLRYLQGRVPGQIGYARLLNDILYWNERVKLRWAREFFGRGNGETAGESEPSETEEGASCI